MTFIHSFQSEWLKTRRSLAAWLVIIGSFFIPAIMFAVRLVYHEKLQGDSIAPAFWETLFGNCWQTMAFLLLPMGVILSTSLIAQLEYRNNTWKQLHTTPQYFSTIFLAKFAVIATMMLQFLVLFNIGILLTGFVPHLLFGVALPQQPVPWGYFLTQNAYFFVDCLPIIALQYLISLQFKNFLVPLGVGFGILLASLISLEWKYCYWMPYTHCSLNFYAIRHIKGAIDPSVNYHAWALGYFVLFMLISFILYITQKQKG